MMTDFTLFGNILCPQWLIIMIICIYIYMVWIIPYVIIIIQSADMHSDKIQDK